MPKNCLKLHVAQTIVSFVFLAVSFVLFILHEGHTYQICQAKCSTYRIMNKTLRKTLIHKALEFWTPQGYCARPGADSDGCNVCSWSSQISIWYRWNKTRYREVLIKLINCTSKMLLIYYLIWLLKNHKHNIKCKQNCRK